MLHFGTPQRYILHAPSIYCGWSLFEIWTKVTHYSLGYHNKHKTYERMPIIAQIWHRAKCNFTCIINTCYLITVPYMNKINKHCYLRYHNKHKIWHRVSDYFIHMQHMRSNNKYKTHTCLISNLLLIKIMYKHEYGS